jgi:hypothetical protein
VQGAFLKGPFADGKYLYLLIPQGFEKFYEKDKVLHFHQTIYGSNLAALALWKKLLQAFENIGFRRSLADLCLYINNTSNCLEIGFLGWTTIYY